MGSSDTITAGLPDASSPSIVLTHPTEDEKRATWAMTSAQWAGALTQEQYLEREPYLTTIPVSRDGGLTHWILTENPTTTTTGNNPATPQQQRPLLSSCESIMKKLLVASPAAASGGDDDAQIKLTEEIGHAIGNVYTCPAFRGRSYASRMLNEVGVQLADWSLCPRSRPKTVNGTADHHHHDKKKAICSALWSDIGKTFYAKKGWVPHASKHVEFLAAGTNSGNNHHDKPHPSSSKPITYGNLAEFCALDEAGMRKKLVKTAKETGKTAFAFSPSHDQMLWHLYRDSFIASIVFPDRDPTVAENVNADGTIKKNTNTNGVDKASSSSSSSPSRQPRTGTDLHRHPGDAEANEVKGIVVGPEGQRVWAIWTRNYSSQGPAAPEKATLYILRLAIENEHEHETSSESPTSRRALAESFTAVIRAAQAFAAEWSCGRVDLWNPTGLVARLLHDSGLDHEIVDRDESSIPSLMWYGQGVKAEDVVWVHNEKYCWC